MRKKPTRKRPYFTMESAMTAILRDASGKMHHGILFDPPLDTGRKLEKILKCRNGFFSRGDNTAFFMELGIEAELNERFTTLLIIGSKSSIQ